MRRARTKENRTPNHADETEGTAPRHLSVRDILEPPDAAGHAARRTDLQLFSEDSKRLPQNRGSWGGKTKLYLQASTSQQNTKAKRIRSEAETARHEGQQKRQSVKTRQEQTEGTSLSPASQQMDEFCASLRSARVDPAPTIAAEIITFDQIASTRQGQESADIDSLLGSFFHGLSSGGNNTNSLCSCDTAGLAGPQQPAQPAQRAAPTPGQTGSRLPQMDWSLKTVLRFTSHAPFLCCEQALAARPSTVRAALHSFAGCNPLRSDSQEQLLHALMTWQYPDASMEPAAVAALTRVRPAPAFMPQRKAAWVEAARCLLGAVRSSTCDAFYLISPAGTHRPFVAFFGSPGMGARPRIHAWLSHSTRGLRGVLRAPPHALSFSMPLAAEAEGAECASAQPGSHFSNFYGRDVLVKWREDAVAGIDGTARSLLLFQGAASVQGLFDHLLGDVMGEQAAALDVPTLLAPVPFPGASLQHLLPQMLPTARPATQGSGKGAHKFEVHGLIAPWVLHRLCRALQDAHGSDFQVAMNTEPLTRAFNIDSESDTKSTAASNVGIGNASLALRGCIDLTEMASRQAGMGSLAGLVMRELSYKGGLFSARLAAVD